MMVQEFRQFGYLDGLGLLIGAAEVPGAALLLILCATSLAAIMLGCVMLAAVGQTLLPTTRRWPL